MIDMKLIRILIFGNIYISVCAVVMCIYTYNIFEIPPSKLFLTFVFFASMTSYSFHWYLTPDTHSHSERYIWVNEHKPLLLIFLIVCSTVTLILLYFLKDHLILLLGIAVFTFFYSASKIPFKPFPLLKKIIIGKTIYLALAWTIVSAVLPILISSKVWDRQNTWFSINRFLLIYPVCILFDFRDKEEDKNQNIKNIVGLLSMKALRLFFYFCMLLFFISLFFLYENGFAIPQLIINAIPGILLLFSYEFSIRTKSDYWYYFYLDGIMMLSGILFLLNSYLF